MLKAFLAVREKVVAAKNRAREVNGRLGKDSNGAALVEYSILIGLITVAAIAAIMFVSGWIANAWGNLQNALP